MREGLEKRTKWAPVDRNPDTGRVNLWKKVVVDGGKPPTHEDLPATNPSGEQTRVEGLPDPSPMYPTTNPPKETVPMGGVPRRDD